MLSCSSRCAWLLLLTRVISQYLWLSVERRNWWQPGISQRQSCWFTEHVCRGWFFRTQSEANSRRPFCSVFQGNFFLPALNTCVPARTRTHVESFSVTYTMGVSLAVLDFLVCSWCFSLTFLALSVGSTVCVFSPVLCGLHSFPFYQNKAWCSVFVFSPREAFFTHMCLGQSVASLAGFILSIQNSM